MEDLKQCNRCEKEKTLDCFHKSTSKKTGRVSYSSVCKECYNSDPKNRAQWKKNAAREKERRKDPKWFAYFIVRDLKFWDKKHGFISDLDVEYVQSIIQNGCSYCDETNLRVSLDRIDNTKGHTKDNVAACCIRCNYLRTDMPYEAWKMLVPMLKKAREKGLFKDWLPSNPFRKRKWNI